MTSAEWRKLVFRRGSLGVNGAGWLAFCSETIPDLIELGGTGIVIVLIDLDQDRRITWGEEMSPGTLPYIHGQHAHRVANVGNEPLIFWACWGYQIDDMAGSCVICGRSSGTAYWSPRIAPRSSASPFSRPTNE